MVCMDVVDFYLLGRVHGQVREAGWLAEFLIRNVSPSPSPAVQDMAICHDNSQLSASNMQ